MQLKNLNETNQFQEKSPDYASYPEARKAMNPKVSKILLYPSEIQQ